MEKTDFAIIEENLNFDNSHNKGQVFYRDSDDALIILDSKCHVYFKPNMLWKIYDDSSQKRIKKVREASFALIKQGYSYLGGL